MESPNEGAQPDEAEAVTDEPTPEPASEPAPAEGEEAVAAEDPDTGGPTAAAQVEDGEAAE